MIAFGIRPLNKQRASAWMTAISSLRRRVWQYAIRAVLHERRQAGGWRSQAFLQTWQLQRREYVQLYQQHLGSLKAGRITLLVSMGF